jgi:uncharacterized membrane protein YgcG
LSRGSQASNDALGYLRGEQRPNGGYAPGKNLSANAQATAWVAQGLLAAGKDPAGFGTGSSSLVYLQSLQAADGKFLQGPSTEVSPVWVTAEAMIPLAGSYLPIAAPPREPQPQPKAEARTGGSKESETTSAPPAPPPSSSVSGNSANLKKFLEKSAFGSGGKSSTPGRGATGGLPFPSGGKAPEGGGGSASGGASGASPEAAELQYGEQASTPVAGDSGSSSGTAGAILLGLLAGCVLFGLGLAGRRGWMHWRYGL